MRGVLAMQMPLCLVAVIACSLTASMIVWLLGIAGGCWALLAPPGRRHQARQRYLYGMDGGQLPALLEFLATLTTTGDLVLAPHHACAPKVVWTWLARVA